MRTKSAEHIKIINTRVPEKLDKIVTKYCIDNNKSKSEFVREAVEHYISYLKSKISDEDKTYKQITEELIEEFENNFNHLN